MRLNKNYHPKHTPICHLYFLSILSTKNHRISTRLLFFLHFSISNRSDVTSRYPFAISSSRSHLPRAKSISRKQYPVAIPLFHAIRSENDRMAKRCVVFEERENRREGKYPPRCPRVELRFHGGLNSSRELPLNEDLEVGGASRIRN